MLVLAVLVHKKDSRSSEKSLVYLSTYRDGKVIVHLPTYSTFPNTEGIPSTSDGRSVSQSVVRLLSVQWSLAITMIERF